MCCTGWAQTNTDNLTLLDDISLLWVCWRVVQSTFRKTRTITRASKQMHRRPRPQSGISWLRCLWRFMLKNGISTRRGTRRIVGTSWCYSQAMVTKLKPHASIVCFQHMQSTTGTEMSHDVHIGRDRRHYDTTYITTYSVWHVPGNDP